MVQLAVAGESRLSCDDRELARAGKSYTIDSLAETRAEIGPERSLCMVMGCDALLGLDTWHRWRELLDYGHIVVIARPGWTLPDSGEIASWLAQHRLPDRADMAARPAGGILIEELRPQAISSTEIRDILAAGRSARYLVPEAVLDYIQRHGLYSDT